MRNIEQKISPLIKSMFPSFYMEEGENFVAFMEAYYEWLEQNFQLIDLEDNTGFEVGNTINQEEVSGTIVAFVGSSILVLVDDLQTFKCLTVCSELIPVTTYNPSDGKIYSTYIQRGGTTRRLGTLFYSRNLTNIRDIDKTLDLFVVKFKEKYLKNIEFDTATNKKLLVKNSLDLYRSKGTSRSIDLFFRLIYGIKSEVYYPGDDLFRLSDAEWYTPRYIEINSTSVERAVALVGKQITGVTSGATAFVERYVKKKVNNSFIHVFYVSSVQGEFVLNELLKGDQIYPDSPFVLGSLGSATVITKSNSFKIGDIVTLNSDTGDDGLARVTSTAKTSGEIEYTLTKSGYGYSKNSGTYFDPPLASQATQSYTSDHIIRLNNVKAGKMIDRIFLNDNGGGSGYSNSDIIVVPSLFEDATARPITDASGTIVDVVLTNRGSGFFPEENPVEIMIMDSTGTSPSAGVDGSVNVTYMYPDKYFYYLDTVSQNIYTLQYSGATFEDQLTVGSYVQIGTGGSQGVITRKVPNQAGPGDMTIAMLNRGVINNYDEIVVTANTMVRAVAYLPVATPASGRIIHVSNTASLTLGIPTGTIAPGNFIYQVNQDGTLLASGTVTKTTQLELDGGIIDIKDLYGIFEIGSNINVEGTDTTAPVLGVGLEIAVVEKTGTFNDLYGAPIYANSGFSAEVLYVSSGMDASYKVGTLSNAEDVKLNVDRLSNTDFMNTPLSALAYGFPENPTANSQSVIYGALDFVNFTIGSIATLAEINPGTGYNQDPVTSVYQPFITGFQKKDYIFEIENVAGSFVVGENITQQKTILRTGFFMDDTDPYKFGEKVHVANTTHNFIANGVIAYIDNPQNYMILKDIEGTVPARSVVNNYTIKSLISNANVVISNTVQTNDTILVKAEVAKLAESTIYAKRIQFDDYFDINVPITGSLTGATADIVNIYEDDTTDPIGFNAKVNAEALYANGTVTGLQVTDSGFGFNNGQVINYTSGDGLRSGTAYGRNVGVGTGSGYYKNSKGFVSDLSKVHDGDYYQEYSYDIISKFPLEKYSDMFKKVMHTAGTRVFGSVLVDSTLEAKVSIASVFATGNNQIIDTGSVIVSNTSPFVIQDRYINDVVDRGTIEVEIRD